MKRLGPLTAALATLLIVFALPGAPAQSVPEANTPHRIVVIIFENKPYDHVMGDSEAPYFNALTHSGTLFNHSLMYHRFIHRYAKNRITDFNIFYDFATDIIYWDLHFLAPFV